MWASRLPARACWALRGIFVVLIVACSSLPPLALGVAAQPLEGFAGGPAIGSSLDAAQARRVLAEAEEGLAEAQYMAGLLTLYGSDGVRSDHAESYKWFRQAAAQGHIGAQTNVALMLLRGIGVEPNHSEAASWFKDAAESGNADAQWMLGRMYYDGLVGRRPTGFPDMAIAAEWFTLAAQQNSPKGTFYLGTMHEYGLGGAAHDYSQAGVLYQRAARLGEKEAGYYLGVLHLYGRGMPQNFALAAKLIRDAAMAGIPQAMLMLGKLHTHGQGVERDYRLAVAWFGKAALAAPPQSALSEEANSARDELQVLIDTADQSMLEQVKAL